MTPNGVVVGVPDVAQADLIHLRRCVELASEAVDAGDFPFGSVLVAGDGAFLAEDRNRENSLGDATRHPEFELARWAAANMGAGAGPGRGGPAAAPPLPRADVDAGPGRDAGE
jgi:tRNA(Arg) A34 adenosine deaminase TadA